MDSKTAKSVVEKEKNRETAFKPYRGHHLLYLPLICFLV